MELGCVAVVACCGGDGYGRPAKRETNVFVLVGAGETMGGEGEELLPIGRKGVRAAYECLLRLESSREGNERGTTGRERKRTSFRMSSTAFLSSERLAVLTLTTRFLSVAAGECSRVSGGEISRRTWWKREGRATHLGRWNWLETDPRRLRAWVRPSLAF